jgi:hypothetical protein
VKRRGLPGVVAVLAGVVLACACAKSADADATITTEIQSKLETDRIVTNPSRIQVTTNKKVVTLSGPVDSPDAQKQAVKLARSADGVKNVVDNLSVAPGGASASSGGAPNSPTMPPISNGPPPGATPSS